MVLCAVAFGRVGSLHFLHAMWLVQLADSNPGEDVSNLSEAHCEEGAPRNPWWSKVVLNASL